MSTPGLRQVTSEKFQGGLQFVHLDVGHRSRVTERIQLLRRQSGALCQLVELLRAFHGLLYQSADGRNGTYRRQWSGQRSDFASEVGDAFNERIETGLDLGQAVQRKHH